MLQVGQCALAIEIEDERFKCAGKFAFVVGERACCEFTPKPPVFVRLAAIFVPLYGIGNADELYDVAATGFSFFNFIDCVAIHAGALDRCRFCRDGQAGIIAVASAGDN